MIKTQFGKTIKVVRSDNGSEFMFEPMLQYYEMNGMLHQTICVGTLQQNGRVKRKHRHILNVAQPLRFQANLPILF